MKIRHKRLAGICFKTRSGNSLQFLVTPRRKPSRSIFKKPTYPCAQVYMNMQLMST